MTNPVETNAMGAEHSDELILMCDHCGVSRAMDSHGAFVGESCHLCGIGYWRVRRASERAAARLRHFIRTWTTGGCRKLSVGDACDCLLCEVDRLDDYRLSNWVAREDRSTGHLTIVAKVDNAFDVTVGAIGSHRARSVSVYPPAGCDVERFGSELVKIRRVR